MKPLTKSLQELNHLSRKLHKRSQHKNNNLIRRLLKMNKLKNKLHLMKTRNTLEKTRRLKTSSFIENWAFS